MLLYVCTVLHTDSTKTHTEMMLLLSTTRAGLVQPCRPRPPTNSSLSATLRTGSNACEHGEHIHWVSKKTFFFRFTKGPWWEPVLQFRHSELKPHRQNYYIHIIHITLHYIKSYLECPKSQRTTRTLYKIKEVIWEYSTVACVHSLQYSTVQ